MDMEPDMEPKPLTKGQRRKKCRDKAKARKAEAPTEVENAAEAPSEAENAAEVPTGVAMMQEPEDEDYDWVTRITVVDIEYMRTLDEFVMMPDDIPRPPGKLSASYSSACHPDMLTETSTAALFLASRCGMYCSRMADGMYAFTREVPENIEIVDLE